MFEINVQTADRTLSVVSEETAQGCHFSVCRQNERWLGRANAFARMKRVMTGPKQMSLSKPSFRLWTSFLSPIQALTCEKIRAEEKKVC